MLVNRSSALVRHVRTGVFMVIAALLIVPPLVRAISVAANSPIIRLNRGFEAPPTKPLVTAPHLASVPAVAVNEPKSQHIHRASPSEDELLPDSPSACAFDPLRGPPFASIA